MREFLGNNKIDLDLKGLSQDQKDDDYYKIVSQRAVRNYLRKWGSWIKNDEYQYPIIPKKYNILRRFYEQIHLYIQ